MRFSKQLERHLDAVFALRARFAAFALVLGVAACSGASGDPSQSTERPFTGPVELPPSGVLIPPGAWDLAVASLDSVSAVELVPLQGATALSEGIVLEHAGGMRSTEPRVLSGSGPGEYRLTNETDDPWHGHVLCLCNEEQVRCTPDSDVWRVELLAGHAVDLQPEFQVGPGDRIQLLLTAEAGFDQPTRIGGAYAGEVPDTVADETFVTAVAPVGDPLDCATAVLDRESVRLRLCEPAPGAFRIVAVTDGTALSRGSARRQIPLFRPLGTGEFIAGVAPQLADIEGAHVAVVVLWIGVVSPFPEAWYVSP